uniref:Uncharacterized protein n=2 Tax=unclassified bacterial viruses TaxID=12333 RepID=A0AAU7J8E8_9VIRU
MSRLESAERIEGIVGAPRHATLHLGRAVSAEQRVYILHSAECLRTYRDLRACPFSVALDEGIDMFDWSGFEDRPVALSICDDFGDLLPHEVTQ